VFLIIRILLKAESILLANNIYVETTLFCVSDANSICLLPEFDKSMKLHMHTSKFHFTSGYNVTFSSLKKWETVGAQ